MDEKQKSLLSAIEKMALSPDEANAKLNELYDVAGDLYDEFFPRSNDTAYLKFLVRFARPLRENASVENPADWEFPRELTWRMLSEGFTSTLAACLIWYLNKIEDEEL